MTLYCPECNSKNVTLTSEQMWMANSDAHWCNSVKTHDSNSKATCLDCDWRGVREDLLEGV